MPTDANSPEDALAVALAGSGAQVAFGVPGGGANLAMIGALERHGLRFVLAHAETPACIMASTYGHLSGSVSAAVVTRGPGAASAVNGAAQATLDRQPLILISDTVTTNQRDRVAHQRIDQAGMLGPVCKTTMPLSTATAAQAVATARSWPPGCVHLDQDPAAADPAPTDEPSATGEAEATKVATVIATAARPVVIVGAGALTAPAEVRAAIERFAAPTFTTYQAVGVIPTDSSTNAGLFTNGATEREFIGNADLVILIGLDMVEPIPAAWPTDAPVVSIAPIPTADPYAPIAHEVTGDVGALAAECLGGNHEWDSTAAATHRSATNASLRHHDGAGFGPIEVVDTALEWAGSVDRLTTTVDAGAHFLAIMPLWDVAEPGDILISNGLATMGYAVPAAIGSALARPEHRVLALTGDGGLGMTLAELETIARLDLSITVVVFNDAALSLIKIKQGPNQGGAAAVAFRPIDFAAVAQAHGTMGIVATNPDELAGALRATARGPALIDARIDPSTYTHLFRVTRG